MLETYWNAIQQKVCVKCIDGDRHGNCRLSPQFDCGLKKYFPNVVHVVQNTHSDNVLDYLTTLRKEVCGHCQEQTETGVCYVRNMLDCPLDRYFPLIIATITDVHQSQLTHE
ncbi:MAG TPA: hypothetical protein VMM58_13065 [Bacteroidota bacterium]|nr:hypothetical protein [Bacteroidota bacterium]